MFIGKSLYKKIITLATAFAITCSIFTVFAEEKSDVLSYNTNTEELTYNTESVLDNIIEENFRLILKGESVNDNIYEILKILGTDYNKTILDEYLKKSNGDLIETLDFLGIDVFSLTEYLVPKETSLSVFSKISHNPLKDKIIFLPLSIESHILKINAQIMIDVPNNSEYKKAVTYVTSRGIMIGVSSHIFSGTQLLSRTMLAKSLYNIFVQDENMEYFDTVDWAYEQGIIEDDEELIYFNELEQILKNTYKKYLGIDIEFNLNTSNYPVNRYDFAQMIYEIHKTMLILN